MRAHNDWKKLHQDYLESGVTKVEFSKMLSMAGAKIRMMRI